MMQFGSATPTKMSSDLCHPESFWRGEILNGTHDSVDLSLCFQDSVIVSLICAVFWLLTIITFIFTDKNVPPLPLSWLNVTKIIMCCFIMMSEICSLIYYTVIKLSGDVVPHYSFIPPVLLSLTMVWMCMLVSYHRKRGVRSSGVVIIFWISLVFYESVKLRTTILLAEDNGSIGHKIEFSFFVTSYVLSLIQMILSFIPERKTISYYEQVINTDRKPCPEETAPFFSVITWWWMNSMIWKGFRRALSFDDLFDLNQRDKSGVIGEKLKIEWNRQANKRTREDQEEVKIHRGSPSLLLALVKAYGFTFFVAGFFKIGHDLLAFGGPLLLRQMIVYISDETQPAWRGYFYAGTIFVFAIIQSLLLHQYFHRCLIVGMRIRAGLVSAIYGKALLLNNKSRQSRTIGEIVNLMSVDAQRFLDLMPYLHIVWSGPLQVTLALIFLYLTMGPSIFAGVVVMLMIVPLNAVIASYIQRFSVAVMAKKDLRVKMINEILNGIKIIKLYAWEVPFRQIVMGIREEEIKVLKKMFYFSASVSFTWMSSSFVVAIATFTTYAFIHHDSSDIEDRLTPQKAFVALSLFELIRFPLAMMPMMIQLLVQANVSMRRISSFLKEEELDPQNTTIIDEPPATGDEAVSVRDGSFTWDKPDIPTLSSINLTVRSGELVAIVGSVGAGKSSLLSALLGEMNKLNGHILIKGSVAYVPQLAWIQNATIHDNILFGKPFNELIYNLTLHCCALEPDLEILPGGDMTEIGEKGINLSGGQKQRVSLARAVYQESDVYLLDDPLSAVDSHVGKHIFDKVIGPEGVLKGKVRILVTHGVGFLPQCDKIIVMDNGRITEVGSYSELIEQNRAFAEFLQNYASSCGSEKDTKSENTFQQSTSSTENKVSKKEKKPSVIMTEEKVETGTVSLSVFLTYVKSCTYYMGFLVLVFFILTSGSSVGQNLWLAHWSNQQLNTNSSMLALNLGIYGVFGVVQIIAVIGTAFALVIGALKASRKIHDSLLNNILRSPMSFFDTTPLGRILNRFSKDIDIIDEKIPLSLNDFLFTLFEILATFLIISIASPWFIIVIVPLVMFYGLTQRIYVATSRQLKRLESSSRSPIFSHFQESINGISSIRAYRKVEQFLVQSESHVDYNQLALYPSYCANRWLAVRLEFIGNLMILSASLFAALQRNFSYVFGRIDPGLAGLSISYSLMVTQSLNWMVRMTSELETNIVAVERTKEYSETPTEAADIIPNHRVPPDWPTEGRVQFDQYSTRYRHELDLVLKNISCDIPGGQKVGIVGRTGAGKSSLTVALFRIIEAAQGAILIDGVDISSYGLTDLRSHITIIPQDQVLFSGTLRINLDPFNNHTDDDIWNVLETAHLSQFIRGLTEGLEYPVAEGGENLSVGQRQLVCLARALLRKTKILVLDEATAAVDLETDDLIQKTIHKEFADCTILTIAHRLNTIMDYDRIMVLDDGQIVEFDSPNNLLTKHDGVFFGLAKDAGLV